MEYADCTPSLSQSIRLHRLSREGRLSADVIYAIMSEEKANQKEKLKIPTARVRKFFPKDYTAAQMAEEGKIGTIIVKDLSHFGREHMGG